VRAGELIVPLGQGHTMIICPTRQIDGLVQVLILFVSEETILVC
jgi:hypothetical protein